jgi:hypothetical protein
MLTLADVSSAQLKSSMRQGNFRLGVGRFSFRIDSALPELVDAFCLLYDRYPVSVEGGGYDFDIAILPVSWWRRWLRRSASFSLSGQAPFLPMAANHAHALFEWGLNWTIGSSVHQYLILHSAVVEKNGKGVLLAAVSGSGKSTLAAELAMRGWRLLSDELALIEGPVPTLIPFPRPVSLKNDSIELIRLRHAHAVLGPAAKDTQKGTIAHLRVPDASVDRSCETAPPALIVFPQWSPDSPLSVTPVGGGQAALRLIDQAFNYPILGHLGFERLADLVNTAKAWDIRYSSLDDAVAALDDLIANDV